MPAAAAVAAAAVMRRGAGVLRAPGRLGRGGSHGDRLREPSGLRRAVVPRHRPDERQPGRDADDREPGRRDGATPGEPVEERRLADVGAADEGDEGAGVRHGGCRL